MKKILLLIVLSLVLISGCSEKPDIELTDKDYIHFEDSGIIEKQIISEKIRNDTLYCTNREDNPQCICQEGYFKWSLFSRNDCIPLICDYIKGDTPLSDDLFGPNIEFCEWAVRDKRVDVCNSISYTKGQEICILAYVGVTKNTSVCEKIENKHLKNECYKDEKEDIPKEKYCEKDDDCVADKCCHASNTINKRHAPNCSKILCTLNCGSVLDCVIWKPRCKNNTCGYKIIKNEISNVSKNKFNYSDRINNSIILRFDNEISYLDIIKTLELYDVYIYDTPTSRKFTVSASYGKSINETITLFRATPHVKLAVFNGISYIISS